jgi:type VI secretion system protein VasJ
VLGLITSKKAWHWNACGKHPAVRDYFKMSSSAPLPEAFSNWIDKGYRMIISGRNPTLNQYSWRFWARSTEKKGVACGVVRDSSDSLGRSYPFLIMGIGTLDGWEGHWNLLPLVFENAWSQIEYLSARVLRGFRQLEDEVRLLRSPHPNWSELKCKENESLRDVQFSSKNMAPGVALRDAENSVRALKEDAQVFVTLESERTKDPLLLAGQWHSFLKTRLSGAPNAVFMGGIPEEVHLAVFVRPLVPTDFVRLWSICSTVS